MVGVERCVSERSARLMDDEGVVRYGLGLADAEGREIDDLTARIIASWWHGGQASKLYAFASSGAILEDAWGEVAGDYWHASEFQRRCLDYLGSYFVAHGLRGPVEGWSKRLGW